MERDNPRKNYQEKKKKDDKTVVQDNGGGMKLFQWYVAKRMERCLRRNEKDPNAFIFLGCKKVYRDFGFARKYLKD